MMSNQIPLFKKLLEIGESEIKISSLKEFYKPIDLAKQLKSLEEQELVIIDWICKTIIIDFDIEKLIINKKELNKVTIEVPDYMKDQKIEINKPFLNIKKGEQD